MLVSRDRVVLNAVSRYVVSGVPSEPRDSVWALGSWATRLPRLQPHCNRAPKRGMRRYPPPAPSSPPAPPGWNSSTTFSYFSQPLPYTQARSHCQSLGGDLASIHNAAENAQAHGAVREHLRPQGTDVGAYIGFSDHDSEGAWSWVDGSVHAYTNWAAGEPNSYGGEGGAKGPGNGDEDCAGFHWRNPSGAWNDVRDHATRRHSSAAPLRKVPLTLSLSISRATQFSCGGVSTPERNQPIGHLCRIDSVQSLPPPPLQAASSSPASDASSSLEATIGAAQPSSTSPTGTILAIVLPISLVLAVIIAWRGVSGYCARRRTRARTTTALGLFADEGRMPHAAAVPPSPYGAPPVVLSGSEAAMQRPPAASLIPDPAASAMPIADADGRTRPARHGEHELNSLSRKL